MQPSNDFTVIILNDNQSNDIDPESVDLTSEALDALPTDRVSNSAELTNPDGGDSGVSLKQDGGVLGEKAGMEEGNDESKGSRNGFEGSVNLEGNGVGESGLGTGLGKTKCDDTGGGVDAKDVGVKGSSNPASFGSPVQKLFPEVGNSVRVDEEGKAAGADGSAFVREEDVGGGNGAVEVIGSSVMVEGEVVASETSVGVCTDENSKVNVSENRLLELKNEYENKAAGAETGALASHDEKTDGEVTEADILGDQENKEVGWKIKAGGSEQGVSGLKRSRGVRNKSGEKLCISDLVWGKVRSHPWWPAQIFEPDYASDQAKKYYRSNSYLVPYFGDQTFAWNDEAKLKPFVPHFIQMVKQSNTEAFRHAVDCALYELGRRVEFGLSCHCIADDAYSRLKTQEFKNAGLREKSFIDEGQDTQYSALTFEPVKFLGTVKNLAQTLYVEEVNRLDHVMTRAQVSAFYRWKGYNHLAEFGQLIGYVNNEADAPVSTENEEIHDEVNAATVALQESEEEDNTRPKKRKNLSSGSSHSIKKEKSLSAMMSKKHKRFASERDYSEDNKEKKVRKSILPSSGRRMTESKTVENSPDSMHPRHSKPSFRVGESILRAAGQLSQPSPLLKWDLSSEGKAMKGKGKSTSKSKQSGRQRKAISIEDTSSDVILSQLLLTAVESPKEHSLLSSMISFVSDFRNSVAQDFELVLKHEDSEGDDIASKSEDHTSGSGPGTDESVEPCSSGGKSKEKAPISGITTTTGFNGVEDDCCPENFTNVPECQVSPSDGKMAPVDSGFAQADGTVTGSQQDSVADFVTSEGDLLGADALMGESPTALTLKFTDMDSIPTEAKLNKIFSTFGPLKESETEVLAKKKCARVVFKRRSDAEAAFSSSGKFETFGASLVCYRLNYAPSPRKSSTSEAKQIRKGETPVESITA